MLAPYMMMSDTPETVKLCFRFQVDEDGSPGDPDSVLPAGIVQDIVRSGAGAFTITLNQFCRWPVLIGVSGSVMSSTVGATVEAAGDPATAYNAATGALLVRTVIQDGTPAAGAIADNTWVYVEVTFGRRTSLAQAAAI